MKSVVICSLLMIGTCMAAYTKQQIREFSSNAKVCYQELEIPFDSDLWMRTIYNQNMTLNEQEKQFIYCLQLRMGWKDSDDNFSSKNMVGFFALNADRQLVTELIDLCIHQLHGETPVEVATSMYSCFFEKKKFDL